VLTYDELNHRANRAAHSILRAQETASTEPIATLFEHGVDAVIGMLGALKAGDFYVPLDLAFPDARMTQILEDSGARIILTNGMNAERAHLLASENARVINIDALDTALSPQNPALEISPDALLNLMYTSGTTGEPKGVIQTQRNVVHAIRTANFPPHGSDEHVAQLTPYSFGGAATMILRTFFFGATLYPFNLRQAGLPRLTPFLLEHGITRFHTVPSVLRNWLELVPPDQKFPALRVLEIGGEPLFRRDLTRFFKHVSKECQVRNALATTETYIATYYFIDAATTLEEGVVPVGYPPPERAVAVLAENGQPVSAGETGEIFVASHFLSPGYWHRPELTAATFLQDPGENGLVHYKTGDLGRVRPDGLLEHLGRKDGMVKVRGHQVVLTFVESALRALDNIKDVAVISHADGGGDQRLAAYLVAAGDPPPSPRELRAQLANTLPGYMIPASFLFLPELPKLPNGKLDRRNLPAVDGVRMLDIEFIAPRTPLESQLAGIWRQVLGVERVGVHDAFVELGGNSLQAAQVVSRVSTATGVDIPLSAVFDVPTVEGLAQLVTRRMAEQVEQDELEKMLSEIEAG
jgi:amino acid adenylation domain-containing protein